MESRESLGEDCEDAGRSSGSEGPWIAVAASGSCNWEKKRNRAVAFEDANGGKKVLVIGLGIDNECSVTLPDGSKHTFKGKEFSCEIL